MKRFLVAFSLLPLMAYADQAPEQTTPVSDEETLTSNVSTRSWEERKALLKQLNEGKNNVAQTPKAQNPPPSMTAQAAPMKPEDRIFAYRPRLDTHDDFGSIEYLLWKPYEQGTDFVVIESQGQIAAPGNEVTNQWGEVIEAKFNWSSGFRVALGCVFGPDFWDIEAQYTYFQPQRNFHVIVDPNGSPPSFMYATYDNFTNNAMVVADSKIKLHYNIGDLFLAKRLQISKQILLRWTVGGIGAWIDQHWDVFNLGQSVSPPSQGSVPGGYTITRAKWKFSGGGFKAGFETDWYFGSGLSLLGKFKGALLFGNYITRLFRESGLFTGSPTIDENPILHDHRLVPTFQCMLGPTWGKRWGTWSIDLYALYELNVWYNLQEVLRSAANPTNTRGVANNRPSTYVYAPFGFQGLTAGVKVNF